VRVAQGAQPQGASAPFGAHLQYFGGRVVSNIQVVQVLYGSGNYIPQVTSTGTPSMASFYQGVLNSPYVDWLSEYNTGTQNIGRGSFLSQVTINPAPEHNGSFIDDTQIQAELSTQIQAGNLPAPSHDAQGNNNTYYAVFFPHGKTISLQGFTSCSFFCAYHGTIANAGGAGEISYGVHPDFQPGSGCEFGCGAAATQFGNYTQVASHELVETMTDPEVGLAPFIGPPLAWYDPSFGEIGDICNDQNGHMVGSDGVTYDVQTEFSNQLNDCVVTSPFSTPLIVGPPAETCRGTTSMSTVTVLGGSGRFTSNVTLSLSAVSPAPPAGGEITATFDPNPVPTPSTSGTPSTMRVTTTAATPPGTYALTVQGATPALTKTQTATLTVRAPVTSAPTLLAPANGADGVLPLPTFTWSSTDQSTLYTLDVFDGSDCTGAPSHTFETTGTSFTMPQNQPLALFQPFSWRVTASNSCGGNAGVSACSNFRTESCSDPHEAITNGGFESGLTGWTVDASVPPPVVTADTPHSGANAVRLGDLTGVFTAFGDSQVSQIVTLAPSSSPTLSFWEWPLTTDSIFFDQQYVRVTPISPAGPTVALMNELRNDRTYIRREFDLSQFAGMTVKITFGVHQDGFEVSGMFIDDVSVTSPNCGPPDFVLHVTPPTPEEVCAGSSLAIGVAADSVNGPNFTSPVMLSAGRLPPGATAIFAKNPINPGESTTLTLTTARPTAGDTFDIDVSGVAVTPPPDGAKTVTTTLRVDPNAPGAPEIASPRVGEINVPRRPTLSWTAPFVPESAIATSSPTASPFQRRPFLWELAATRPPRAVTGGGHPVGLAPAGSASSAQAVTPFAFGASAYHLQIARDAAFTNLVVDTQVGEPTFTVPFDLDIATQYFWRASASNACGGSAFSATGSFIVGACFESWSQAAAFPSGSVAQSTVIASPVDGKLYVISGSGPTDQLWAFDPQAGSWARKADVPAPGMGMNFGAAARVGNTIYAFGGENFFSAHRVLWRYDIAADQWSRGADLPVDNFGAAVAAIDGKIYLAYGSGFFTQTWQYDPATNSYTRKANAPLISQTFRVHGVAVNGEFHAFGGGFGGNSHVIYNPATDTWRTGAAMPFGVTDPAVDVLGGKVYVVGGTPVAHTQVYDPATDSWSQGAPITGATNGVDNTEGAVLGSVFHLIGGVSNFGNVSTHWQFHACSLGALSSATILPFVVDGNGKVAGIGNEASSILIDNSVSGTAMSVSCYLYGTTGQVLGNGTFQVGANELATVADVVRALTHTTTVQNAIGSVVMFGTEVFHGMASITNNASTDPAFEDGQPIAGTTSGFLSSIGAQGYTTQTVFANTSSSTSSLQIVAYPAGGGDLPAAATIAFLPPHGLLSYPDAVKKLGLAAGFVGQLSWTSSQPTAVAAREIHNKFSGFDPTYIPGDATSSVVVPYVEDTGAFSTALEITNPGSITANVTVHFLETSDTTGTVTGVEHTRDLPVAVNSAAPIVDIVRWVTRDTSTTPSGKHGFLVVTTPQAVTAHARIVDSANLDPGVPDSGGLTSAFSSLLVRVEPLPFSQIGLGAATSSPNSESRFALSNPSALPATVQLIAYNATGSPASDHPLLVTLAPHGQFFSDNLAATMGLPTVFLGWVAVQSDIPVGVYNHRRTGTVGSVVPVHRH
jgi:N-acetylneuraminic acid mutarotase